MPPEISEAFPLPKGVYSDTAQDNFQFLPFK